MKIIEVLAEGGSVNVTKEAKGRSLTKIPSPIKFFGGKSYIAHKIVELFPRGEYLHFVEPYIGGGSVLLAHDPEGVSEVINDLSGELYRFWKVLQEPSWFEEFKRRCEATPFSEAQFNDAQVEATQNFLDTDQEYSIVRVAHNFFVRCRQSLAGRMKSFASLSRTRVRRKMNEQASAWLSAIEGLPEVHERLKRVVILNHDAFKVIKEQDGPKALFYIDPPYYPDTRTSKDVYEHEMSVADHWELLGLLQSVKGKFVLSGYRNSSYESAAAGGKWRRVDFLQPNHSSGEDKKRIMVDSCWMNY